MPADIKLKSIFLQVTSSVCLSSWSRSGTTVKKNPNTVEPGLNYVNTKETCRSVLIIGSGLWEKKCHECLFIDTKTTCKADIFYSNKTLFNFLTVIINYGNCNCNNLKVNALLCSQLGAGCRYQFISTIQFCSIIKTEVHFLCWMVVTHTLWTNIKHSEMSPL